MVAIAPVSNIDLGSPTPTNGLSSAAPITTPSSDPTLGATPPNTTPQISNNSISPIQAPANSPQLAQNNPNYLVQIVAQNGGSAPIEVVANCPESVSFALYNDWKSLYSILSSAAQGSIVGSALQGLNLLTMGTGLAFLPKEITYQVWQGTQPIEFMIPLYFNAYNNAYTDVVLPIKNLAIIASPYRINNWMVHAPGPTLIETIGKPIINYANSLGLNSTSFIPQTILNGTTANSGVDWGINDLGAAANSNAVINMTIGKALSLDSIVITSINVEWDSRYDYNGWLLSAAVKLGVRCYYTYMRGDLQSKFFPNPNGGAS